jgi:hypothetical protein
VANKDFSEQALILMFIFFGRPKRNEPKKKGAGNDNFSPFWQNAFGITLIRPPRVG